MKKLLPGALMLILSTPILHAQVNPRGETTLELDGGTVTIEYGRPSLKGRDIKTMIYPGETWRLGADGDTTLTTGVGLKFGESSVARGTYILRAKFLGGRQMAAADQWHRLCQSGRGSPEAGGNLLRGGPPVPQARRRAKGGHLQGVVGQVEPRYGIYRALNVEADRSGASLTRPIPLRGTQ